MSLREGRLARTLSISLAASILSAALAFLLSALVSRKLGASGAGVYLSAVALFTITATTLKLGTDTGLVRTTSRALALERREEIRGVVRMALLVTSCAAALLAAAVWIGADRIAAVAADVPQARSDLAGLLRFLAPFLPVWTVMIVSLSAVRGLGSVLGYSLVLNVGVPSGRLLLVLLAIAAGLGAIGSVRAWALGLPVWAAVSLVLLRVALDRHASRGDTGPRWPTAPQRREFWSFSFGRWAGASVEILLDWLDVLLVAALTNPATAGVYGMATRVVRAGQVVDNAMRVAIGPRISALLALGDSAAVGRLLRTASQAMVLLTWPYYVTCMLFAAPIMGLFGEEFVAAAPALRVLAAGMALSAGAILLQSVILMGGRSHWQLANKLAMLSVVVLLTLVLVPAHGIVGAAMAWVAAIVVDTLLVATQTRRLTRTGLSARHVAAVAALVGCSVAVLGAGVMAVLGTTRAALLSHVALLAVLMVSLIAAAAATKRLPLWAGTRSTGPEGSAPPAGRSNQSPPGSNPRRTPDRP